VGILLALLLVAGLTVISGLTLTRQLDRIPGAFESLGPRPAEPDGSAKSLDVLLVGVHEAREERASWVSHDRGLLNLLVVHVDAGGRRAAVAGLPLEAEVDAPGGGMTTLASVMKLGAPALLVSAVEHVTGIRLDHVAVLDWRAVEDLAEVVGGVELTLPVHATGGLPDTNGPARLEYVAGPDAVTLISDEAGLNNVEQLQRQLILLDGVLSASLESEMHRRPIQAYEFLDVLTENLAVDEDWSGMSMARQLLSMWSLRSADIRYMLAPISWPGRGVHGRLQLDREAGPGFWGAVATDRADEWLAAHGHRGEVSVLRPD
jgi:hypothetical protein